MHGPNLVDAQRTTNVMRPKKVSGTSECEGKMGYIFRFITFFKNLIMKFDPYNVILSLCKKSW